MDGWLAGCADAYLDLAEKEVGEEAHVALALLRRLPFMFDDV